MPLKKSWRLFFRAQVAAFVGGLTDYGLMILFTELAQIYYVYSILLSGGVGALVNFSINRRWAFGSDQVFTSTRRAQLFKFLLVVAGSIGLKSSGTFLVTNYLNIDYKLSRVLVDFVISYGFNFVLIKYWVFKEAKGTEPAY